MLCYYRVKVYMKKYIYLDWNVYKYLSEPRQDKGNTDIDMLSTIKSLKNKFIFPYSEGHIKDKASGFAIIDRTPKI